MSKYMTEAVLRSILEVLPLRPHRFVETGTFEGRVTRIAASIFSDVISIEASEHYFEKTKLALSDLDNVMLLLGDSRKFLPSLVKVPEPCVWYLDANGWDHPNVVQGAPLLEELQILSRRTAFDVIICDELHAFGSERPGWGQISQRTALDICPGRSEARDNMFVIYR